MTEESKGQEPIGTTQSPYRDHGEALSAIHLLLQTAWTQIDQVRNSENDQDSLTAKSREKLEGASLIISRAQDIIERQGIRPGPHNV